VTDFPRVAALLTANGYSPDEADEIILLARSKNVSARRWIKVFAGAGAERARHRQALQLAFPASFSVKAER
jgi:hypothetical protein